MLAPVADRPQVKPAVISVDDVTFAMTLRRVLGEDKVRLDHATCTAYSTDASPFHVEPRAVVVVGSESDVLRAVALCRDLRVPLTPRAAGTSFSGAAIGPSVVLETSGFRGILEFNEAEGWIRVQSGLPLKVLSEFLVELPTFKPAPDLGTPKVSVTYHDPCHLRVSNIRAAPREVLRMIPPFELAEMRDAAVCCGGAGTYSMKNRELSMVHFHRVKAPAVRESRTDAVASSCPACHIQFHDGLRESLPVKHVAVLLDEAYVAADRAAGVRLS